MEDGRCVSLSTIDSFHEQSEKCNLNIPDGWNHVQKNLHHLVSFPKLYILFLIYCICFSAMCDIFGQTVLC